MKKVSIFILLTAFSMSVMQAVSKSEVKDLIEGGGGGTLLAALYENKEIVDEIYQAVKFLKEVPQIINALQEYNTKMRIFLQAVLEKAPQARTTLNLLEGLPDHLQAESLKATELFKRDPEAFAAKAAELGEKFMQVQEIFSVFKDAGGGIRGVRAIMKLYRAKHGLKPDESVKSEDISGWLAEEGAFSTEDEDAFDAAAERASEEEVGAAAERALDTALDNNLPTVILDV